MTTFPGKYEKKVNLLEVPGATLYYEVRGKGPILLMIPAGGGDASSYDEIADYLADWYTVVTYDRRGYSRSKLHNPEELPSVESHGDDAHRLLNLLSTEPVYVYGNSAGAVMGLELFTLHAEQVRTLIAHEPAKMLSTNPLDDQEDDLKEIFKRGGIEALQKHIGVNLDAKKPVVAGDGIQRAENLKFFIEREPRAIGIYKFNLEGLRDSAHRSQVIIGGSTTAKEAIGYRGAVAAANFFHTEIVEFPGDHSGYLSYPKEYAEKIHDVLEENRD